MTTSKLFAKTRASIGKMPGLFYYKPLAVALAFLLLVPPVSWVSGVGHTFSAVAQTIGGCAPNPSRIIQNLGGLCDSNFPVTYSDVGQLETDTVQAYLTAHMLPQSDSALIYAEGRSDLRSELRGYMLARLLAITQTPQAQRTAHEQALYIGLQKKFQQRDIELYSAAIVEFNRFQSDPCHWTPDPDIAKQYNLTYDGNPFCFPGFGSLFAGPNFPSYNYFVGFGLMKNSFGKAISNQVNGPLVQTSTTLNLGLAVATIALPAAVGAAVLVSALVVILAGTIFPVSLAITGVAASTTLLTPAIVATGPFAIVIIAVLIGVAAGFQAFSSQQNINDLNGLNGQLANAKANLPDLSILVKQDQVNLFKLTAAFTELTLPEFSSTQPLPTHRDTDPIFMITNSGQTTVQASPQLSYTDWPGTTWSASTFSGWFVQQGIRKNNTTTDSITPTLFYNDWNGNQYSASRVGMNFLIAKGKPASTDAACPVNNPLGVTVLPDYTACSSYVSSAFQLKDPSGNNVTVSLGIAPAFTSSPFVNFSPGIAKTFTVSATGFPAPVIAQTGALPNNVVFSAGPPATLSGIAATGTEGIYPLILKATGSAGSVTQNFSLYVGSTVTFTSPGTATFTAGQLGSFKVTTAGKPTASLRVNESLPSGLGFKDNGDGTGTISGTPNALGSAFRFCDADGSGVCGVVASNSFGAVGQDLTITVNPAPLTIGSSPSGLPFTLSAVAGMPCKSIGNYVAPKIFTLDSTESCAVTFATPQSAGVGVQLAFTNWGDALGSNNSNPRAFTMPLAASTYLAQFATQYLTTTTVAPHFGTYGEPVTLSATIAAVNPVAVSASGWPINGFVQFAVKGVIVGGPVAVNGAGTYSTSVVVTQGPGTYPSDISAVYSPAGFAVIGSNAVQGSSGSNSMVIATQPAIVTPSATNPTSLEVSAPGKTVNSLTLTAAIQNAVGGLADISNAKLVTFTLQPIVAALPIACTQVTTSVAAGVLTATATCFNVPVNVYNVNMSVGGTYFTGSADSTLAVYDRSLGFVTGDGTLVSTGVAAEFEAEAKYSKGDGIEGEVTYSQRRGTVKTVMESNSVLSLSVVKGTAVLLGKATVNGVPNYTFRAMLIDNTQQSGKDQFGLQVTDPTGHLVTDLSFAPKTISDGAVKLHQ